MGVDFVLLSISGAGRYCAMHFGSFLGETTKESYSKGELKNESNSRIEEKSILW